MKNELSALEENGTWVKTSLSWVKMEKAIDSRWGFKVKFHHEGTIERYQTRVVEKGFS